MSLQINRQLRILFTQLIKGFTEVYFDSAPLYIKHLNNIDISEIDYQYNFHLQKAIKDGLPTYEEKTKYLIENKLWDIKNEDKLDELNKTKNTFNINRNNEYLRSKRKTWQAQIDQIDKDIRLIEYQKSQLVNLTAEIFANRKTNDIYIKLAFYKDKELTEKKFIDEEYDNLEEEKIRDLLGILDEFTKQFSQDNIKKIALSPFFINIFSLCSENVTEFYGKPAIYLTLYQIDVWNWSRYFRNAINELGRKLPPEICEDPDKMIEYIDVNRQYKEIERSLQDKGGGDGGAMSVIGATKDDLAMLGIQPAKKTNLDKELAKKSTLNWEDMARLGMI